MKFNTSFSFYLALFILTFVLLKLMKPISETSSFKCNARSQHFYSWGLGKLSEGQFIQALRKSPEKHYLKLLETQAKPKTKDDILFLIRYLNAYPDTIYTKRINFLLREVIQK